MSHIPTPHINAKLGDFAPTVLMPGDPLRAKFVADTFLTDARLVNNVRGVQGYTGLYNGKPVSVMASGMGMSSIGIYSYELFNFYGVENIIRIGSAGMISQKLKLRDIVVALSCYNEENLGAMYGFHGSVAPCCSYKLLEKAMAAGRAIGHEPVPGAVFSSCLFYNDFKNTNEIMEKMGVLAVEMEGAMLYANAAQAGKNALVLCTISDNPKTGEGLPAEDRQLTFTDMMKIALEIA